LSVSGTTDINRIKQSAEFQELVDRLWSEWRGRKVTRGLRNRRMARRHGKEPLVIIDKPDYSSLHGTPLQRTLYGFTRRLENLLSWYGVYWEERRLYRTQNRCLPLSPGSSRGQTGLDKTMSVW
jgi:hypothetical protein